MSLVQRLPKLKIKVIILLLAICCYLRLWQTLELLPELQLRNGYKCSRYLSSRKTTTITTYSKDRQLTVGIVSNEFFDPKLGRSGGFGMAAYMVGRLLAERPKLNMRVVFIFANPAYGNPDSELLTKVHHTLLGWSLVSMVPGDGAPDAARALREANIDVLLLMDYRKDYKKVTDVLPETPVILWARDPRSKWNLKQLTGIRLPNSMHYEKQPQGIGAPKTSGALELYKKLEDSRTTTAGQRKMVLGVVWMTALRDRVFDAYGIPVARNAFELPNSIVEGCGVDAKIEKSKTPTVIFVGRLDPYKRPWLMVEVAKKFPNVEFWVLGRRHFENEGSYDIESDSGKLPENVHLLGQVRGEEKFELLQKAWFLISTSAHEGLAISYLEALQCRTPVLSTVNPGGIVSSYGVFAGDFEGSGEEGLPALEEGFQKLLENDEFRNRLGDEGREHVLKTHNPDRFLEGFQSILWQLGFEPERHHDPVSIIVPTWSGMDTLPAVLAHLLRLDSMHPDSEILVVHVSRESWYQRARIHTETDRIISPMGLHSSFKATKMIHLDFVDLYAQWGCVVRHIAGLQASNDVLVHLDNDLLPSNEDIETKVGHVTDEQGFPYYNSTTGPSFPCFYGSSTSYCWSNGHFDTAKNKRLPEIPAASEHQNISTNFVAMSSYLNRQFVSELQENESIKLAMSKTKGDGCDLIYNHFYTSKEWSPQVQTTLVGKKVGGFLDS